MIVKKVNDVNVMEDIANKLGLKFHLFELKKLASNNTNCYDIGEENLVFFYPINDGMPTCPFEFYKNNMRVIDNNYLFSEISNLDDIILQMVRIYDKALDSGIVLDPYYFMLKLDDKVESAYKGKASLVVTDKAIRNHKLNADNFDEANKYFINIFLDHFIGWNFGVSVNRNRTLKEELIALNNKVMRMGIREYAGSGLEVYGNDKEEDRGLLHFYLPMEPEYKLAIDNKN